MGRLPLIIGYNVYYRSTHRIMYRMNQKYTSPFIKQLYQTLLYFRRNPQKQFLFILSVGAYIPLRLAPAHHILVLVCRLNLSQKHQIPR